MPLASGYTFSPTVRTVALTDRDVGGQDFTGTPVYTITGRIKDRAGDPVPGLLVTAAATGGMRQPLAEPATYTAVTDANGEYTLARVLAGTYTLTPTRSGYTFVPPSTQVNVTTTSVTASDFSVLDVRVSPGQTDVARAGTTVAYTHVLTNASTQPERYVLTAHNAHGWSVTLTGGAWPTGSITLQLPLAEVGAMSSTQFTVGVLVPADATPGTTARTYLTVTSVSSPTHFVTLYDVTQVRVFVYLPLVVRNQ
jgi:hypothetical protein